MGYLEPNYSPITFAETDNTPASQHVHTSSDGQGRTINLCFGLDNNYVDIYIVALTSICYNADERDRLNIYLLACDLTQERKAKIEACVTIPNVEIHYCDLDMGLIAEFPVSEHISSAAYARLLLPFLLPDHLDKVLYLDCDIIVTDSLYELYNINIADHALAAVEDVGRASLIRHIATDYNLYLERYFNSGVILINLRKWRKYDLIGMSRDICAVAFPHYWDQDLLNIIFRDASTVLLESRFNMQYFFAEFEKIGNEILANLRPVVIHFITNRKPQNSSFLWHALNAVGGLFYFYRRLAKQELALPQFPLNIPYNARVLLILFSADKYDLYRRKILAIQDDAQIERRIIKDISDIESTYVDYSLYDAIFIEEADYATNYGFKRIKKMAAETQTSIYFLSRNGNSLTPLHECNQNGCFGRGEHFVKQSGLPPAPKDSPHLPLSLAEFRRFAHAVMADSYYFVFLKEDERELRFVSFSQLPKEINISKQLSAEQVLQQLPSIHRRALRGEYILLTPFSLDMYHIPLGDVTSADISRLKNDGLAPAAVMEIAPDRYQCLINVPVTGTRKRRSDELYFVRNLNQKYGGRFNDVSIPLFVPGFNKPGSLTPTPKASYPYVSLSEASGLISHDAMKILSGASQSRIILYAMSGPAMLLSALVYHYTYYPEYKCVILVDQYIKTCKSDHILERMIYEGIVDDYMVEHLTIDIKEFNNNSQALERIQNYYDDMFTRNDYSLDGFEQIVTINDTHDGELNLYFNLKERPYIWLQAFKDSRPAYCNRSSLSPVINELFAEYYHIYPEAHYALPIMHDDSTATLKNITDKVYGVWNCDNALKSLNDDIIARLLASYGFEDGEELRQNGVLLLPDSYGHGVCVDDKNPALKVKTSPALRYIPRHRYHGRLAIAIDLVANDEDIVYYKPHPSDSGILNDIKLDLKNEVVEFDNKVPFQLLQSYLIRKAIKFRDAILFASLELSRYMGKITQKLHIFGPAYNEVYTMIPTLYVVYRLAEQFNRAIISYSSRKPSPYYDNFIDTLRLFNHINGDRHNFKYGILDFKKPGLHKNSFIIINCLEIKYQYELDRILFNICSDSIVCLIDMEYSGLFFKKYMLKNISLIHIRHSHINEDAFNGFCDANIWIFSKDGKQLAAVKNFECELILKRTGMRADAKLADNPQKSVAFEKLRNRDAENMHG